MLFSGIVSDQQNCRRIEHVAHAGGGSRLVLQGRGKSREVGGAVMVDIVGLQHHAREFLQQVVFFVGGAVRANDPDRLPAIVARALP